jgi:hypothetical protein
VFWYPERNQRPAPTSDNHEIALRNRIARVLLGCGTEDVFTTLGPAGLKIEYIKSH